MTTELIKTTGITWNGENITAVNVRDLWKFLESRKDFSSWIKRRIEKYGFTEGCDYLLHKFMEQLPSGAKHRIEYMVSLDMAKELVMVENNERGRQARQYFIEVEKRYRQSAVTAESIMAAFMPVVRENERFRARLELAHNFLPHGNPGDLNKDGLPKNKFRRGCYVARNDRDISLLMENLMSKCACSEHELLFSEPVHAVVTVKGNGEIRIDRMEGGMYQGITREMTGNSAFDSAGLPCDASVLSAHFRLLDQPSGNQSVLSSYALNWDLGAGPVLSRMTNSALTCKSSLTGEPSQMVSSISTAFRASSS